MSHIFRSVLSLPMMQIDDKTPEFWKAEVNINNGLDNFGIEALIHFLTLLADHLQRMLVSFYDKSKEIANYHDYVKYKKSRLSDYQAHLIDLVLPTAETYGHSQPNVRCRKIIYKCKIS